jgi:hypothetical protein
MKNACAVAQSAKSPQLRSSPNGSNPTFIVAVGSGALVAVGCGVGVGVGAGAVQVYWLKSVTAMLLE